MEKQDIRLTDIQRILFGDAPPAFMLEVLCRTVIVYTILLFFMRWLGKRMSGQLTIVEMSIMIMLGAIVAVPMQMPDKGLLQGIMILLFAVLIQRTITLFSVKSAGFQRLTEGELSILVKEGVMQLGAMRKARVSRQQLFSKLREQEIYNLGMVSRLYLEACGMMSLFKEESDKPGLSVFPPGDHEVYKDQQKAPGMFACTNCGTVSKNTAGQCGECKCADWINAVI